jgi:hypothetical protein
MSGQYQLMADALFESNHFSLDKGLQGVDLAVIPSLDELDLAESTLANNFECREVVGLFFGPEETQVFGFSSAHLDLLLRFAGVGPGGLFHDGFQLERPEAMSA